MAYSLKWKPICTTRIHGDCKIYHPSSPLCLIVACYLPRLATLYTLLCMISTISAIYLTSSLSFICVFRRRSPWFFLGLNIHTFHGNFFVRSTDLLSLPNVNPDHSFSMQIEIEDNLADNKYVCFQAALLYTTSKGKLNSLSSIKQRILIFQYLSLFGFSKLYILYHEFILCWLSFPFSFKLYVFKWRATWKSAS